MQMKFKTVSKNKIIISTAICLAFFLSAEIFIRLIGLVDFPLYDANNEIGYIPHPSQSGTFLNKHNWMFNEVSMGAKTFKPTPNQEDILLLGDSIVLGGNPMRAEDRLGPQLARKLNAPVWPISAGSWALLNELTYTRLHPDIVKSIDHFIFVLNSGDFGSASSWACSETHPRSRPLSALIYTIQKYVFSNDSCAKPSTPELIVPPRDLASDWREFTCSSSVKGKKIDVFLYPNRAESLNMALRSIQLESEQRKLSTPCGDNITIYSVGRDKRWEANHYRDSIHPDPTGTDILSLIISNPEPSSALH